VQESKATCSPVLFQESLISVPILETPRLILRKLVAQDSAVLVDELNNFNIVRNTARVPYPYHHDDAEDFIGFSNSLGPLSCVAAVELKENPGRLIGVVSYQWSDVQNDGELGYWFSERVWHQGFGTEAVCAMIEHAFLVTGHAKLIACYHDDNPASGRILSKMGFLRTGSCSNFSKAQGREVPVTTLQLLKVDWLNKKAAV
jgi:[ribosomal protein S5]-alanine N-acetyltransferase